jgi:aminopeptidase N
VSEARGNRTAPARAGKRKGRISAYYQLNYPFNKLKKILRHNGLAAADAWAREHLQAAALIRAKKAVKESNWKLP